MRLIFSLSEFREGFHDTVLGSGVKVIPPREEKLSSRATDKHTRTPIVSPTAFIAVPCRAIPPGQNLHIRSATTNPRWLVPG
jgi:hypothetical protein